MSAQAAQNGSHATINRFGGLHRMIAMNAKLKAMEEIETPKQKVRLIMAGGSYSAE